MSDDTISVTRPIYAAMTKYDTKVHFLPTKCLLDPYCDSEPPVIRNESLNLEMSIMCIEYIYIYIYIYISYAVNEQRTTLHAQHDSIGWVGNTLPHFKLHQTIKQYITRFRNEMMYVIPPFITLLDNNTAVSIQ